MFFRADEADMDQLFSLPATTYIGGQATELPLRDIISRLREVYCKHIGVEYMFINNKHHRDWIRRHFEPPGAMEHSVDVKKDLLKRLIRSHKSVFLSYPRPHLISLCMSKFFATDLKSF